MAAEFISSTSFTSSADNSSTSVTVPADTTCMVLIVGGWDNDDLFPPTSLTLNGVALTVRETHIADAVNKLCLAYIVNPATGSQTLAWNLVGSGATSEGLVYIAAFFKGVDTASPIVASGKTTATTDVTGLGSPAAGDMMVGGSCSFDTAVTVTGSSQTSLVAPARFNNAFLRGAYKLAASTYDISGGDDANVHAALVLRAAAADDISATAALVAAGGYVSAATAALRFASTAALVASGGYASAATAALRFIANAAPSAPGGYIGAATGVTGDAIVATVAALTAAVTGAAASALRFIANAAPSAPGGYAGVSAAALRFTTASALQAGGGYASASQAGLLFRISAGLTAAGAYVLDALGSVPFIISARRVVSLRAARNRMHAALGVRRGTVTHYGLRAPLPPPARAWRRVSVPQHGLRKDTSADGVQ